MSTTVSSKDKVTLANSVLALMTAMADLQDEAEGIVAQYFGKNFNSGGADAITEDDLRRDDGSGGYIYLANITPANIGNATNALNAYIALMNGQSAPVSNWRTLVDQIRPT